MKNIVIASSFGHEIMACQFANTYGVKILIAPKKDVKEEYDAEAERILSVMSVFYDKMEIVPFEEKDTVEAWDIISELKAGTLSDKVWDDFFKSTLEPPMEPAVIYPELWNTNNILFVPQKLVIRGTSDKHGLMI